MHFLLFCKIFSHEEEITMLQEYKKFLETPREKKKWIGIWRSNWNKNINASYFPKNPKLKKKLDQTHIRFELCKFKWENVNIALWKLTKEFFKLTTTTTMINHHHLYPRKMRNWNFKEIQRQTYKFFSNNKWQLETTISSDKD